jgi:hypothetical protein
MVKMVVVTLAQPSLKIFLSGLRLPDHACILTIEANPLMWFAIHFIAKRLINFWDVLRFMCRYRVKPSFASAEAHKCL